IETDRITFAFNIPYIGGTTSIEIRNSTDHVLASREITDNVSVVTRYLRTGDLLDIGGNKEFPSASIIKVPIAVALLNEIEKNKLSLDDELVLTESNKVGGRGKIDNSNVGESFHVEDLLYHMLTTSDNSSTNMVIDYVGMDEVNRVMERCGYKNTHLRRKMQYFGDNNPNITTPRDMSDLFEALYRETILSGKYCRKLLETLKQSKLNTRIPARLPKDIKIAHKGGTLSKEKWGYSVVHDAGIVYLPHKNYILSVFTENLTKDDGTNLIVNLS
ncbi:MAG: serine hydrolase, partial [Candidatus Aenigmatarchaeota archaeon]